jgi:hypothetical protein
MPPVSFKNWFSWFSLDVLVMVAEFNQSYTRKTTRAMYE